jgi:hypothetical protein
MTNPLIGDPEVHVAFHGVEGYQIHSEERSLLRCGNAIRELEGWPHTTQQNFMAAIPLDGLNWFDWRQI